MKTILTSGKHLYVAVPQNLKSLVSTKQAHLVLLTQTPSHAWSELRDPVRQPHKVGDGVTILHVRPFKLGEVE